MDSKPTGIARAPVRAFDIGAKPLDTVLGCWMARKEDLDARRVALRFALEDLEQLHHAPPVPPGATQQLQSHSIGFTLVVSAEFQEHAVREQSSGGLRGIGAATIAQERPQKPESKIRQDALRELTCCMPLGNVGHLMGEDARDLRFVRRRVDHSAM